MVSASGRKEGGGHRHWHVDHAHLKPWTAPWNEGWLWRASNSQVVPAFCAPSMMRGLKRWSMGKSLSCSGSGTPGHQGMSLYDREAGFSILKEYPCTKTIACPSETKLDLVDPAWLLEREQVAELWVCLHSLTLSHCMSEGCVYGGMKL